MIDQSPRLGRLVLPTSFLLLLSSISPSSAQSATELKSQTWLVSQAGSTGGTLGNDDKSASGTQRSAIPAQTPVAKRRPAVGRSEAPAPHRHVRTATQSSAAASSASLTPSARPMAKANLLPLFNGVWAGVSTGPCIPRWTWEMLIDSGAMLGDSGSNINGQVRPNGNAVGIMVVFGTTYNFIGHITASEAIGTWVKPGPHGCSGVWTATKQ